MRPFCVVRGHSVHQRFVSRPLAFLAAQVLQRGELPVPEAAGGLPGGAAARRPPDLPVRRGAPPGPAGPRVRGAPRRPPLPRAPNRVLPVPRRQHRRPGDGGRR